MTTDNNDHLAADRPSPNTSDDDPLAEIEEEIEDMDGPQGANERTTAAETLEGDTMDERLAREVPDRNVRPKRHGVTVSEDDETDTESEMIGTDTDSDGRLSPEEAAMHVTSEAAGATDHPDDYVNE
jgi:uncharacterized protein DUF5709